MKFVIGNWKMNMNKTMIKEWFESFNLSPNNVEVIIAPSFLHIQMVRKLAGETIHLAAQDVSKHQKGSHTGDVSAQQVKEFCKYSIIGHSERKEDEETVIQKINMCLETEILPIVCFVNTEAAKKYMTAGAKILAWEDPDNISKGGVFRDKPQEETVNQIKQIRETLGIGITLIYGGSVNKDNIKYLSKIDELDGVLPGHASLDPVHFLDIVGAYQK